MEEPRKAKTGATIINVLKLGCRTKQEAISILEDVLDSVKECPWK